MNQDVHTREKGSIQGVLEASYAGDRKQKSHMAFRYRLRSFTAARAYDDYSFSVARRILDLGASEGASTAEIHRLLGAEETIGLEASAELVNLATDLPTGCRVVEGDISRLEKTNLGGKFDLVTALAVMEHLKEPAEAIRSLSGLLNNGGLFVATSPVAGWDRFAQRVALLDGAQHETDISGDVFAKFIKDAGIELIEHRRFMFAPVGFLPYLKASFPISVAYKIDRAINQLRFLNFMFVNQLFVARLP